MATKTARFELVNPYQKYGLKRKPTFNEILALLSEDQTLLRPFPGRTATQFRNSPQGSFFDGSDHVELLKEQQNRVLDRQMREMLLRSQVQQNGRTFHKFRHQDNTPHALDDDDLLIQCRSFQPLTHSSFCKESKCFLIIPNIISMCSILLLNGWQLLPTYISSFIEFLIQ